MIGIADMKQVFRHLAVVMAEKRDELITLDSVIGDGDLGITMDKAFTAAADSIQHFDGASIGAMCIDAGKNMAKNAPSTMGTLMATGFMYGGKALGNTDKLDAEKLYRFFNGFLTGVVKRGKAKVGEKTLLDVIDPVVSALENTKDLSLNEALVVAEAAAEAGLEATKQMVSQHGKAAIYREQTLGKQDPGATAGYLLVHGFRTACEAKSTQD